MNETTVTVVGTVCSEVRYGQATDTTPIARFQLRTTPRRFDKRTNTWTDGDPSYYSAICFRNLADHVASSMGVGDPVVATGRLRISRWRRGEENMVTAELDVQAIGHDLRWGTTVYRRATPPGGSRIPGPGRRREEAAAGAGGSGAAELELAGVGAGTGTGTGTGAGAGVGVAAGAGVGASASADVAISALAATNARGEPGSRETGARSAAPVPTIAAATPAAPVPVIAPPTPAARTTAAPATTEVMDLPAAA